MSDPEFDAIRAAIAAAREEADLRADLTTYRANYIAGQVERDDAWEAELLDRIADAERRQLDAIRPHATEGAHALTAMPRNVHRDDELEPCPACGRAFVNRTAGAELCLRCELRAEDDRPAVHDDPVRHGGSTAHPGVTGSAGEALPRPAGPSLPATPTTREDTR